jgi:hypothetical protein
MEEHRTPTKERLNVPAIKGWKGKVRSIGKPPLSSGPFDERLQFIASLLLVFSGTYFA